MNNSKLERILKRIDTQKEKEEKLSDQLRDVRKLIKDLENERDAIKGRMIVEKLQSLDIGSIDELNEFLDEIGQSDDSEDLEDIQTDANGHDYNQ